MTQLDKKRRLARNNAWRLLRSRPRSEFEIRTRLKEGGYDDSIVNDLVEELRLSGDIDDGKFARFWMESRMHSNPVGDIVLKQELKQKGVSESIIEATLEAKAKSYDEYEVAFNMAQDHFERLKKLDRRKAAKRLYDFLARRGFAFATVQGVIEKLVNVSYEDR